MPSIRIQNTELQYEETDIINFREGLIGIRHLRRMVLVRQTDIEPFMWLASLDDECFNFLVVDPMLLFPDYQLAVPADVARRIGSNESEIPVVLSIVKIAGEWNKTTVNLRAPLFISASSMNGVQSPLLDSTYALEQPVPLLQAA